MERKRRLAERKDPYIVDYPHDHPTPNASFNAIMGWIQFYVNQLFHLQGTVLTGTAVHPSKGVMGIFPDHDQTIRARLIEALTSNPLGPAGMWYVSELVREVDSMRKCLARVLAPSAGMTRAVGRDQPKATQPNATAH